MADQKYIATIELEDHIDAGRILKRAMAHLLESDRDRRCGFEMALLSKAYRDVQYPPEAADCQRGDVTTPILSSMICDDLVPVVNGSIC